MRLPLRSGPAVLVALLAGLYAEVLLAVAYLVRRNRP